MTAGPAAARRSPGAPGALLVLATLALIAFYYFARADAIGVFAPARGWAAITFRPHGAAWHFGLSALVLGVVPACAARALTGATWSELGLGLGRWRRGLAWLAVGVPLAILAGRIAAASPALRAVYPLDPALTLGPARFVPYALASFLYFGAWEVLFRAVLLFGLRPRLGAGPANAFQTALSVTAHFGRAFNETAAALPAGLLFGWLDLEVGSIWYVAVIHWLVGVSQDWFILIR